MGRKSVKLNITDEPIKEIDELIGWGAIAAPFALILMFSPLNGDFFGLPKVTLLYLISIFLAYLLIKRSVLTQEFVLNLPAATYPVAAMVVLSAAGLLLSETPLTGFVGRFGRYDTLPALICSVFIGVLAYNYAHGPLWSTRFIYLCAISFVLVNLYGFSEILGLDIMSSAQKVPGRISATLGNPVFYGGYLAMTLPFWYGMLASQNKQDKRFLEPSILIALLAIGLVAAVFTRSRGAWIGIVAGLAVSALSARANRARSAGIAVSLLAGGGLVFAAVQFMGARSTYLSNIVESMSSSYSMQTRFEIWKSALAMLGDRPLTGFGLGQTGDFFSQYASLSYAKLENIVNDRTHNAFLQYGLDGGVLLLLAFLWLLFLLAGYSVRAVHGGRSDPFIAALIGMLAGYAGQALTGINTLDIALLFWVAASLTLANASTATEKRLRYSLANVRQPALTLTALVVCCALAVMVVAPSVTEAVFFAKYKEAKGSRSSSAFDEALRVAGLYPYEPLTQLRMAELAFDFYDSTGERRYLEAARSASSIAYRYSKHEPEVAYFRARAELALAIMTRRREYIERTSRYSGESLRLAPYYIPALRVAAQVALLKEDMSQAKRYALRIRQLRQDDSWLPVLESISNELSGDSSKAEISLRSALKVNPDANRLQAGLKNLYTNN